MKRILIIKHGSLGDIIFSLSVLKSIKVHYFDYEIDLLTEKKYFDFFKKTNYFHNFIEDNRSNNYLINFKLIYLIINNKYDYILDLQNSSRTSFYNFFVRVFGKSIISSSRSFSHFKYINNWDLVDVTCPHIIGPHLMEKNRKAMESFLKKHYKIMPRTMLRYAIEKLPVSR